MINDLEAKYQNTLQKLADLQQKESQMELTQNAKDDETANKLNNLHAAYLKHDLQINETKHIEEGTVNCGGTDGWTHGKTTMPGHSGKYIDVSVKFAQPYTSSPVVYVATQDLYINQAQHAYFQVNVVKQDLTGFTVRCSIWDNSDHSLWELRVAWISVHH